MRRADDGGGLPAIEWRVIFLVAAILPVGSAMESSGTAALLAGSVMDLAGPAVRTPCWRRSCCSRACSASVSTAAPAVVLLTPVVLEAASGLGLSPYPLMMGVALAASAAFMTPFSHKANLLVMGAGGLPQHGLSAGRYAADRRAAGRHSCG